jgi:hypothetical protein
MIMNSPQNGHRDAADVLHQELIFLFDSVDLEFPEVANDLDLFTHFVKQASEDKILTFMTDDFGRGFLAAMAITALLKTAELAELEENAEGGDDDLDT